MGIVCLGVVLLAGAAKAQINSGYQLPAAAFGSTADGPFGANAATPPSAANGFGVSARNSGFTANDAFPAPKDFTEPFPMTPPSPPEPPQGVYGVFPKYDREAAIGFQYVRFYEVPGAIANSSGVQASLLDYLRNWVAVEAQLSGGFGSLSGTASRILFGGAGARLRWSRFEKFDVWAHALGGISALSPQPPYGTGRSFGYEVGAGVGFMTHRQHWGCQVEGDAVGTFYFSTYQVSPKIAVSAVYHF
jgi:hypothetical protein